jgi:hypothetical protein
MNWRRIHTGGDETHRKEWIGGRGRYKIIWRDQVQGVDVPPAFHVLILETTDGEKFWELLHKTKRLKRTLKAAKRACEVHANPPKPRKKRKKNV